MVALHDSPGLPDLTIDELSVWLGDHLARFKHPEDLVVVDALPRNASGKVLEVALRKTYSPTPA